MTRYRGTDLGHIHRGVLLFRTLQVENDLEFCFIDVKYLKV